MSAIEANGDARPGSFALAPDGASWTFHGALTFDDAARVLGESAALPLPKSGRVEFSGLAAADSAALAVMAALKRRASRERHKLAFTGVPAGVAALARVYGIDGLLGTSPAAP
jgi:phospholipid transport system transporter-binding protein